MEGKIERYYNFLKKINDIKNIEGAIQLLNDLRLENFPYKEEKRLRNKIASKVFNKKYELHVVYGMTNYEAIYDDANRNCFYIGIAESLANDLEKYKEKTK